MSFGTDLWEHDVSKYGACADKHEEHQVEEEKDESDDLQCMAVVVVGKQVQQGGDYTSTHDYRVP